MILKGLRNFEGGCLECSNTPNPPSVRHWSGALLRGAAFTRSPRTSASNNAAAVRRYITSGFKKLISYSLSCCYELLS